VPYIVMKRSDIPSETLQILDLVPNESRRNPPYEPTGQTKYVDPVANDPLDISAGPTIILTRLASGLSAFFITTIDDGGGDSLTAAEAEANADAVLALVGFGVGAAASDIDIATVNAAITGTLTAGQFTSMLEILAGRPYVVPQGVQVETGGSFDVDPAVGDEGGPQFGEYRPTYDTGALTISFADGQISGFMLATFDYNDATGAALVVYNDDGTLFTP
jgi:hypothetical protein